MDYNYNTQREKLKMPEYGRYVQKMIEQVCRMEDKKKRSEQLQAVVNVMSLLNPIPKDVPDARRKLWDHAYCIADYDIDVDAPYPVPDRKAADSRPAAIPYQNTPLKAAHYGRHILNMIEVIASKAEGEEKNAMIKAMATYMRQQYLIWNKDSVSEETIFADIAKLSDGKLIVPETIHLDALGENETFSRPALTRLDIGGHQNNRFSKGNGKKNGRKRWKKQNQA